MKRVNYTFCAALLAGAITFPSESHAASAFVGRAKVTKVLAHSSKFGMCMAELSKKSQSLNCSNWVTFDCNGDLEGNTKTAATRKFDIAQLALVTNKYVKLAVTDSKKINGICFADRIEVWK